MASPKLVINPAQKRRAKRRNPTTATKAAVANKRRRRRRNPTAAVSATPVVANKSRRRRRNPAPVVANKRRRSRRRNSVRNGFFGNSKETTFAVLGIGGGIIATKTLAPLLDRLTGQFIAQFGMNAYRAPLNEFLVSLGLSWLGDMVGKGVGIPGLGKNAMFGGFAVTGIDLANAFAPSVSPFNVFNNNAPSPVLLNQAAAIGAATALRDPVGTAAKLSGMRRNGSGGRIVRQMPSANLNRAL